MGMKMTLSQIQCRLCSLCGQIMDQDSVLDVRVLTDYVDGEWYKICPNCGQSYPDDVNSEWREKVDRWYKRKVKK
jgi:hypothetical protein